MSISHNALFRSLFASRRGDVGRRSIAEAVTQVPAMENLEQRRLLSSSPIGGGYLSTNLGDVPNQTAATFSNGTFDVRGRGDVFTDGFGDDGGRYVYREASGDFTYVARLVSRDGGGHVGLMVRSSLDPDAEMMYMFPNNIGRFVQSGRAFDDADRRLTVLQFSGPIASDDVPTNLNTPVWMRLDRVGDVVTGYASADGETWEVQVSQRMPQLQGEVLVGMTAGSGATNVPKRGTFDNVELGPTIENDRVQTTYFGNSSPGAFVNIPESAYAAHVIRETGELLITGANEFDDVVVLNRNGEITASFDDSLVLGGRAITGNGSYIFAAEGHVEDPNSKRNHNGFVRVDRNGENPQRRLDGREVRGLALDGDLLYVVDADTDRIRTFDAGSLAEIGNGFSRDRVDALAVDGDGNLWMTLLPVEGSNNYTLAKYTPAGTLLASKQLAGGIVTRGLAYNPVRNEIWVSDLGFRQAFRIHNVDDINRQRSFGAGRGVNSTAFATRIGEIDPRKFNFAVGIGFDAQGNYTVVNNGAPGNTSQATDLRGSGLYITKASPSNQLIWDRLGQEFVELGDFDPGSGGDVIFTPDSVYEFNTSAPAGREWEYVASTVDLFEYPDDPRITEYPRVLGETSTLETGLSSVDVARVDGQRVMFVQDQQGRGLAWYRFEGDSFTAIPAGWMDARLDADGDGSFEFFFWQDRDGDGARDANEVATFATTPLSHYAVTDDGQIYASDEDDGYRFFETTIVNGIPTLSSDPITNPVSEPALFTGGPGPGPERLKRVIYDRASDSAIVTGMTEANPRVDGQPGFKEAGTTIARYDNWTGRNGTQTLAVERTFAVENLQIARNQFDTISDVDAAGEYVFAVRNPDSRQIQVYRRSDLELVDRFSVGSNVGGRLGVNDLAKGINVIHDPDAGTYRLILEDSAFIKNVVVEWTPPAGDNQDVSVDVGEAGSVSFTQNDANQWRTVNLTRPYNDPVVVIGPASAGGDPGTVRVRNVTSNSFQYQLDEWDYLDGVAGRVTVGYAVIEAGTHSLEDGTKIVAGNAGGASGRAKDVGYGTVFSTAPTVLAQIVSQNQFNAMSVRVNNVRTDRFQVRIEEEQAADGNVGGETVSWIAIEQNSGSSFGTTFSAGRTSPSVNENFFAVNATPISNGTPVLLANVQTRADADTATLRYRNLNGSSFELMLDEEESADAETTRTRNERVGWLLLNAGTIRARS